MILAAILPKVAILVQTDQWQNGQFLGKYWSTFISTSGHTGQLVPDQPPEMGFYFSLLICCDHQWLIPKIDRTEVKVVFKRTSYRRLSHCTVTLEALAQLYQWRDPVGHDSWCLHNGHPSPSPVFYFCNKFYFCKNKISVLSLRKNKLRWNVWGS